MIRSPIRSSANVCRIFKYHLVSVNAEFTQSPMYHKNATSSWPWSANALGPYLVLRNDTQVG